MEEERGAARRLVRRTDDRMLGGVCSGLADHFGTDPLLFRLGFVALSLLGFTGIVLYGAAWVLVPADGARPRERRALSLAGVALLVAAAIPALFGFLNSGPVFPGNFGFFNSEPLAFAALLVVVGVVLLRQREDRETPAETAALPAVRATRPRRQRSGLTLITLAIVLLVVGVAGLGSSAGWVGLDVGQIAAVSLLLVGLGLVVGAWWGRARLLIGVGILMLPVVLAVSLIDYPASGTIGSPYVHMDRAGELEDMEVLVGQATIDLADYPFREGIETASLRVGAGSMTVIVPHDVRVRVQASVEAGEAHVLEGYESGLDVAVTEVAGPEDATKRLELEIEAGLGTVGVYRMNDPRRGHDRQTDRPRREEKTGRHDKPRNEKPGRDRKTRRDEKPRREERPNAGNRPGRDRERRKS